MVGIDNKKNFLYLIETRPSASPKLPDRKSLQLSRFQFLRADYSRPSVAAEFNHAMSLKKSEFLTRRLLIDEQLKNAGWNVVPYNLNYAPQRSFRGDRR